MEDSIRRPDVQALKADPKYVAKHLRRIKIDTFFGMRFSNVIAMFPYPT